MIMPKSRLSAVVMKYELRLSTTMPTLKLARLKAEIFDLSLVCGSSHKILLEISFIKKRNSEEKHPSQP